MCGLVGLYVNYPKVCHSKVNEKGLLIYEQASKKITKSSLSTVSKDYFEHLCVFLQVLGPIVDDLKSKGFLGENFFTFDDKPL